MGKICAKEFRTSVPVSSVTFTDDGYGGQTKTISSKITLWAKVVHTSGNEIFNRTQTESTDTIKVTTRYTDEILDTDIIILDGIQYDIKHQNNVDHLNRFLIITAESQIDE